MAQPRRISRREAERAGRMAETIAAWWLRCKGYRLLAHRFRTKVGEIDLVMRRGDVIAFIEVKQRATENLALEAVTPTAQQRLAAAADLWALRHPIPSDVAARFDIVTVVKGRPRHWPDAWRPR